MSDTDVPSSREVDDDREPPSPGAAAGRFGCLSILLMFLNIGLPVFGPLVAGVLSVWLVFGHGYFWARLALVSGLVMVMGTRDGFYFAFLLAIVFLMTGGVYVLAQLLSHLGNWPTRSVRFTLWELGGGMTALAVLCGLGRGLPWDDSPSAPQVTPELILDGGLLVAGLLAACFPVLVPREDRNGKWFGVSAVLLLLLSPLILSRIVAMVPPTLEPDKAAILLYGVAVPVVWILVYSLEAAGAFNDADEHSPVTAWDTEPEEREFWDDE